MRRILNAFLPGRLGSDFRWIWSSSSVGNLGDGVLIAAGPLLVASITHDAFPVAMALFLQRLPYFLLGLPAGAIIDRVDRRSLVIAMNLIRCAVLAILALALVLDRASLPVIFVAMFALGTAETFADNASIAVIPLLVPRDALGQANARLIGTRIAMNQLAGPPLGAFLFALGIALPFGFNAVCFALAVVLFAQVRLSHDPPIERTTSMRREVADGLAWLWAHAPVRTLIILIAVFNVTFGAAFSVLVLYALERLGLSEVGYGFLLSASAVGGLVGSAAFRLLEERFSYAQLLRIGLTIETLTHLGLALTTSALLASAILFLFGIHAVVWGTTSATIRQRAVPARLLGRVQSVYMIGVFGPLALGTALGGAIAQRWGVTAPFWFAFVGAAITTALMWRSIANVADAGEPRADDPSVPPQSADIAIPGS
ncbi:MAG TPA: MFS transporter [Actinomycetota bacterium]|nr:MFS transporter [Actinomycetota bacterium]